MDQRGFLNVYVVIAVALLAVIIGYFIIKEEAVSPTADLLPTASQNVFAAPAATLASSPNTMPFASPATPAARFKSMTELKYGLENSLGKAVFCGPPVVTPDYSKTLITQFPMVAANSEEFPVILRRLGITSITTFTDQEKLAIVNEHNRLSGISLTAVAGGYRFIFRVRDNATKSAFVTEGIITATGEPTVTKKDPDLAGCPL